MNKIIFLLSFLICFSCTKKELVIRISSQELIDIDYKSFAKIDSLAGYKLLSENPELFNWSQTLDLLKRGMPESYLSENLDYEKDKAIKDFHANNHLISYPLKVNDEIYSAIITKSANDPDEWMEKGYSLHMYLINGNNKQNKPILISTYIHAMGVTSSERQSITEIYSDNSIKVKIKSEGCSDLIINNKIRCDSTSIINLYQFNTDTGKIKFSSDTIRYNYSI